MDRKCYQTVWEIANKIHDVMGKSDYSCKLSGQMELDDAFFTTDRTENEKLEDTKRGRGSQDKTAVLVMTESEDVKGSTRRIRKKLGHVKMIVIPDLKASTITEEVKRAIEKDSTIITDKSSSYNQFKDIVKSHVAQVVEPEKIGKVLPWVHVVISNAKRLLLDMYHHVSVELLQGYLNEFYYKLNRRYENIFDKLVDTCQMLRTDFRHRIYSRKAQPC